MVAAILISFGLLIVIGIPIGFCLGLIPLVSTMFFMRFSPKVIPHEMFSSLDTFPLMAIPLFILAGNLMNTARITHQLIRLSNSLVGWIRGGLAQVNIVVSMLFAGLNGSAVADAVSVGSVLIPVMKDEGYDADFAAAVTASSSMIGAIIPPSVGMVIYGSTLGVSIGALFAAGIIPGLMIGLALMIVAYVISVRRKYPVHSEKFRLLEFLKQLQHSILPLMLPVIIIGGIIFGVFTATEAAGIAVGYTAFLALVVYRNVSFSEFIDCLFRSGVTTGVILLLVGASAPFAWLITILEVPKIIAEGLTEVTTNKFLVLILINVFLLVMGMLLDATANILILGPILMPVALAFGIEPIHFSLVMIINLVIGLGTPPVGTVLFATVPIAKVSVEKISVAILPFCLAQLAILGLVTYVPALTMWIPTLLGYVY